MPSLSAATRKEMYVALTLVAGAAIWLFTPAVAQPDGYFPFADQRRWLGIPNAADVLSNLAFVAVGLLGLNRLQRGLGPLEPVARLSLYTFFIGLFLAVCGWWATILPSHDRDWRREVAVMPEAFIDGDTVRITDVRDFDYRTRDDFTVRYKERTVSLSHLTGVDFYVSFWMEGPIGHTFLSFVFDNAPPLAVSIETRPEVGEGYSPLASMFKEYELIYIVGDERDLVRLRTNYRDEEVFLYRLTISPVAARRLFLLYLERINELHANAEWYHLLSNSCTINIVRYANIAGRTGGLDIRHILNGLIDRYFYNTGLVNTSLGFDELRRRSNITEVSRAAGNGDDFPQRIRANLPPARP